MNEKQIILDGISMDVSKDTIVATTFQINNIGDLKSRKGDHTNKFKLPFTSLNNKAMNLANKVQSNSSKPYKKLSFKYIEAGVEVIPVGYAIVDQSQDAYEVTGYTGNSDFFELINGLKLRDLDLTDLIHKWQIDVIAASRLNTSGYIYPIINYNQAIDATTGVYTNALYPAYFVHTLFEKIVEEVGWTLDGAILTDARYLNMVYAFSQSTWEHSDSFAALQLFEATSVTETLRTYPMTYTSGTFPTGTGNKKVDPIPFDNKTVSPAFDNNGNYSTVLNEFVCQTTGNYTFEAQAKINWNVYYPTGATFQQGFTNFTVVIYNGVTNLGATNVVLSGTTGTQTIKVNSTTANLINKGDVIRIVLEFTADYIFKTIAGGTVITLPTTMDITFKNNDTYFKNAFDKAIVPGSEVDSTLVLPDESQVDFMKDMMNILGISPDAESETQTLHLRAFKELQTNLPKAKNWSKKWVEQKPKIEYRIGNYFQVNDFKYKQDYGVPPLFGNGAFDIADETLAPEGTIIDLKLGATIMQTGLILDANSFPLPLPIINNFQKTKITQRILMLDRQTFSLQWNDGLGGTETHGDNIPCAYFYVSGKTGNLDWQSLLDEYYPIIIDALQQSKKVTGLVKLNTRDVHNFDHFIPVYIEQLSAYFYVNAISNYKRGVLTNCELIRI